MEQKEKHILILGNGVAGFSAAAQIRELNSEYRITLLTMEDELFYNRMSLSKALADEEMLKDIYMEEPEWYEEHKVDNMLHCKIIKIHPEKNQVVYENLGNNAKEGEEANNGSHQVLTYDVLIYALGAKAFIPNIKGVGQIGVTGIRSIEDAKEAQKMLKKSQDVVIVGGGILGLEAAWQCALAGKKVSIVEAGKHLLEKQLDVGGSNLLLELLDEKGIKVFCNSTVMEVITNEDAMGISGVLIADAVTGQKEHEIADASETISSQQTLPAGLVIVACGILPNTKAALQAGIGVGHGVIVEDTMQTSVSNIFACGDCVQMKDKTQTNGLWAEAASMGKVAGINAVDYLKNQKLSAHYLSERVAFYFRGLDTVIYSIGQIGMEKESLNDWAAGKGDLHRELRDASAGIYEKYFFHKDKLVGAILIGVPEKITEINERIGVKREK